MTETNKPFLSVVVPVFNSSATLEKLCREVDLSMLESGFSFELILMDDGSSDNSWQKICELKKLFPFIKGFRLHRNSGQHKALMCGIGQAKGEWIVTLDDDLQFSPYDISKLFECAVKNESTLVYGIPPKKENGALRNLGSKFLSFVFRHFADLPVEGSSFKIVRKDVADKLASYNHPFMFIDEVLCWNAHHISTVRVKHIPRASGVSGYGLTMLFKVAIKYIIGYTTFPLRVITYFGLLAFIVFFIFVLYFLYMKFEYGAELGFTALIVSIFMSSGFILFSIGVIGEYLNRLFLLQSGKPIYIIKSEV